MQFLQQVVNGLTLGAIYALIALGYTMVYGVLRLINFAHGDVYMLGAYAGLFAAGWFGVNEVLDGGGTPSLFSVALVFLAAMVICAVVGVLIERFAYRPLRNSPRLAALITAIGISMFLEFGGQAVFSPDPRQFPTLVPRSIFLSSGTFSVILGQVLIISFVVALMLGLHLITNKTSRGRAVRTVLQNRITFLPKRINASFVASLIFAFSSALITLIAAVGVLFIVPPTTLRRALMQVAGFDITLVQAIIFGVAFTLMLALQLILTKSKVGRAMRAVAHDRTAASLMGINTDAIISFTFALGSALAAAGGILNSIYTPKIDPLIGLMVGLKAFVAAVLGGIGSIPGAVLGGLVMGFAETATVASGKSEYRDAIAFAILIAVLILRPAGLLGKTTAEKV